LELLAGRSARSSFTRAGDWVRFGARQSGADLMIRELWARALVMLLVVAASAPHAVRAEEFRCWNGGLERRIELSSADDTQGLACEVRYWRDATAPGNGRVLWQAQKDAGFCRAKALELLTRLEAGGWRCDSLSQPASAAPAPTRETDAPPVTEAPAQAAPAAVAPDEPRAVEPADPSPPTARTFAAVAPDEPPAVAPPEPLPPASATAAAPVPAAPNVPPFGHPAAPLLDQVLSETLRSVEQLYGGEYQAEHAAFGDLDGDGVEDAAVLITHQPERNDYVQYLVAYLFKGETFQSVATKNVSGRFLDAMRAALQGIADGRILVELESLGGDAACCVARRIALVLDGGQLVEVADPGAPDAERTSQTEPSSPG
jgi:hypothetical protein